MPEPTAGYRPTYLYRFYDTAGHLLYVGVTRNLDQRVSTHRAGMGWAAVAGMAVQVFSDRYAAEDAERAAILAEDPAWNRQRWQPTETPPAPTPAPRRVRGRRAESPEESRQLVFNALLQLGRPAHTAEVAERAQRGLTLTRNRLGELVEQGRVERCGWNRATRYNAVGAA